MTLINIPESWDQLKDLYPIRPIRTDEDYSKAAKIVDKLCMLKNPSKDQQDYLDVLSSFIETYDQNHKKERKEITPELMHELTDRASIMFEMFNSTIMNHDAICHYKEIDELSDQINDLLDNFYQLCANKEHNLEQN
jgi:hypothetical protein